MKKIIMLTMFIFLCYFISCRDNKKDTFLTVKLNDKILKINNKTIIDLNKNIDDFINNFNFEKRLMPGQKGYKLKDYNIELQVSNSNNKIITLVLNYYYDNDKTILIKEFEINNLKVANNTSFEKMKKILEQKGVKYEIEENEDFYYIEPNNNIIYQILYSKNNLNTPKKIMIDLEK